MTYSVDIKYFFVLSEIILVIFTDLSFNYLISNSTPSNPFLIFLMILFLLILQIEAILAVFTFYLIEFFRFLNIKKIKITNSLSKKDYELVSTPIITLFIVENLITIFSMPVSLILILLVPLFILAHQIISKFSFFPS